ncbi:hypothetical protein ACA910_011281 [Epithemia clementina (nom. ined.)]
MTSHRRAQSSAPNPFDGPGDSDGNAGKDAVPSALVSGNKDKAPAPANNNNPFDLGDVDFAKVQKRRDARRAAKEQAKEDAAKALLQGMDATDEGMDIAASAEAEKTQQSQRKSGQNQQKPKVVIRSKTVGAEVAGQSKQQNNIMNSILGTFVHKEKETIIEESTEPRETLVKVGQRKLAIWPYDDYHLVQKAYYERLGDGTGGSDQEEMQTQAAEVVDNSSIPIFQRPADPPDIPSAVMGLQLTDFEAKAEERSIAIVSTWLFDAGLIDELLVNGGMMGSLFNLGADDTLPEEGVEIGSHGFPIEGPTKMDKEVSKLRNATRRQLSLINARLNDGVAATGSEVQELVNLVIATKDDIGRLRELSTYVSNTDSVEQNTEFMLTNYPKLKQTINARRNLARCFRELDFFSQIPTTCDRLREEMHAAEYTAHEWSTLRSVCREHVELEIFLVEAEAGMKKRLEEEENDEQTQKSSSKKKGRRKEQFDLKALSNVGLEQKQKNELIDKFLSEHVENVWELGDEIRLRIMSGIASAFELAMNNPGGMVALVEAVEVYDTANEEYKAVHGVEAGHASQNLRFTDMRPAALGELYKDFERRGLDIFSDLISQAADIAEEDEEVSNQQFTAVLRAANELTSEIGLVKEQMAPCFPPSWAIETLWTTCVAHVCSNNILQQIGGTDGHKLPDLTVTQLLDLVAWVESFREVIEEAFPNIASIASKRTYFDKPPKLLVDNKKSVDLEAAQDTLAWVNNILWDVHDLSKDEFLYRTKEQTEEWLDNVYEAEPTKTQTADGRLVTSLCEDVYSLAGVQLRTIRERLTRRSEALVQAVGVIFKNLYEKQIATRDSFCKDFEECCAASNDFVRMSEKCEEIVSEIQDECNLSPEASETLEEQAAALLGLYSGDAIYAAQKTHLFIFEPIEEAIAEDLFSEAWLDHMTHNEAALTVVRTLDDFMGDLENFLDEVMVQKCVEAQVSASVNFYISIMLKKASEHNSSSRSYFSDNEKALTRMRVDIQIIRDYFEGLSGDMPTLTRCIERDFGFLDSVIEVVAIAAGISDSDIHDFVLVLQKTIKNFAITKFVVGDIYHLVKPSGERAIYELIDGMESEMAAVAPNDEQAASIARSRMTVPGLRVDQELAKHIQSTTRNRPLQAGTLERAENALRSWTSTWGGRESTTAPKKEED